MGWSCLLHLCTTGSISSKRIWCLHMIFVIVIDLKRVPGDVLVSTFETKCQLSSICFWWQYYIYWIYIVTILVVCVTSQLRKLFCTSFLMCIYWSGNILNKMANILKTLFWYALCWMKMCFCIWFQISLLFVREGSNDIELESVHVVAWCRTGEWWTYSTSPYDATRPQLMYGHKPYESSHHATLWITYNG